MAAPIVQYIVVRSDLIHQLKWPTGALIAQACHACTAAIHLYYSQDSTKEYLADLDRMHKIILDVSRLSYYRSHTLLPRTLSLRECSLFILRGGPGKIEF